MKTDARIESGTIVTTTQVNPRMANEWTPGVLSSQQWGVTGVVLAHSDSHGLCYQVLHEDGSTSWYDPSEITVENSHED
jgi:hypothetical protein